MDEATRDALRDVLGASVVEVHDLRPRAMVRHVWRVRTAGHPERVIVKAVIGDDDDAARAWTMVDRDATALATAASSGCVAGVVAHDRERRIVVIEDLGAGRSLADLLMGDDAGAAREGLSGLASAMGRLHAATAGGGFADDGVHMTSRTWESAPKVIEAVRAFGVDHVSDDVLDDVGVAVNDLIEPGPLNALIHGDPCPDNNVIRADGSVALFDFEWACYASALLDAVYLHMPFPSCWCANAIPVDVVAEAEEAYRDEFAVADVEFDAGLAAAALAWCVTTLRWVPRFGNEDAMWGIAPNRPRFVTRLRTTRGVCERAGRFEAFTAFATDVERALAAQWPDAAEGLPLYPAFR